MAVFIVSSKVKNAFEHFFFIDFHSKIWYNIYIIKKGIDNMAYKGSIEPNVNTSVVFPEPKQKMNIYKVTAHYSDDRNPLMRAVLETDSDAIIKPTGDWSFKVKTKLKYSELFNVLIRENSYRYTNSGRLSNLRRVWWF